MTGLLLRPAPDRARGFRLALAGCLFTFVVVGLGAFTRLVDAGLGCPDWPTCYGHALWPTHAEEVERANRAFPDAPVEHDKTWPEMVHRYAAATLGLFAIALAVQAVRRRGAGQPLKLPLFLLGFIILQGLFGMWTVTLKLWPQVVTAHLLGGFTTLTLFWLMTLRLGGRRWQLPLPVWQRVAGLRRWAWGGLAVVVLQIALGGWTTSNYAAVACPDLPTCQQQWWPAMDFAHGFNLAQDIGPNYLGGAMHNEARVAIHMSHRIGAVVTLIYLLGLAAACARRLSVTEGRIMAWALALGVLGQVGLGLANVLTGFALTVAVAHNLFGALLLLLLVSLNYQLHTARPFSD